MSYFPLFPSFQTYSYGLHAPGLEINGHPSTSISDINLNPNPHLNPNPNLNPSTNLHLVPDYSTHRHPRSAPESIPDAPTPIVLVDNYLGPEECVRRKYTHLSCKKAFCPSWMRCENGTCVCKMSFECPRHSGRGVCGLNGWRYSSHCEALADSCLTGSATFSHFGDTCSGEIHLCLHKHTHTHTRTHLHILHIYMLTIYTDTCTVHCDKEDD